MFSTSSSLVVAAVARREVAEVLVATGATFLPKVLAVVVALSHLYF
jgi:hypothetical protein